jgi:hypothetical protein
MRTGFSGSRLKGPRDEASNGSILAKRQRTVVDDAKAGPGFVLKLAMKKH